MKMGTTLFVETIIEQFADVLSLQPMTEHPKKSFSLASLMLFMLVVALVLSQLIMVRQLGSARAELDALRRAYDVVTEGKIKPPGGVPLRAWEPGAGISVAFLREATKRLENSPQVVLDKWIAELERITDSKFETEVERQGARTDFVNHMSVAFDGLTWNTETADKLFKRAQTMPASAAKAWKEAFEMLLNKELQYAHIVPLVLIPVDALYDGTTFNFERSDKYLARVNQLTADDITLWKNAVDEFGGTKLDAAVNIILLNEYFDKEKFQRYKFIAALSGEHHSDNEK